ncbi:hypothetical protein PP175_20695 [Aneurinibacillus sp. Ricciae_BoGa-3]|uniref:hypothetical protein n=1 Tax=Aneurinibacillus sp. Ricciae_BoGa-3 TaxID=3022697 RepID=UPI0023428A10|nr:hypothetical protein [Aneurinibacillus sp. Ricciae_BoGa-3]WCK53723.1 hypothetical protein PP175_20695 [Aneurinibacillus sp. Ricciae_BoGa-3]
MKKTSFYTWFIHRIADGFINVMEKFSRRIGSGSVFGRLKQKADNPALQEGLWALFILLLANVFILLFFKKMKIILGFDLLAAVLLVFAGPARLSKIAANSLPGKLLRQMFDPNK